MHSDMAEYRIRTAKSSDIDRILEMTKKYGFEKVDKYSSRGTLIALKREDAEPIVEQDRFWVAYLKNGHVIGCASLVQRDSTAELRSLVVEEPYRRNGIGSQLINCVIQEAYTISNEIQNRIELWARYPGVFVKAGFEPIIEGRRVHMGEMPQGYLLDEKILADCNNCILRGELCPEILLVYHLPKELSPIYL
jgi:N-acetylglutamate synthase-like GNAT family acetyltransferase